MSQCINTVFLFCTLLLILISLNCFEFFWIFVSWCWLCYMDTSCVGLGGLCSNFYLLFYSFLPQNLPIITFKEPIILTLFSPKVTRCNVQLQWFYFKTTFITIKLSRQTYMYTLYTSQVQTSELTRGGCVLFVDTPINQVRKCTSYSSIILNSFCHLLFSKLCQRNLPRPSLVVILEIYS